MVQKLLRDYLLFLQTAKVNGLAPSKYIEYALDNIVKQPKEDLLPWSNKLPSEIHLILKQ